MNASQARIVLTTAANRRQARSIARGLIGERLAACVNVVGPIRSIYRWRGAIEDGAEFLLMIKTRARLLGRVERRVRELHTYEVPEVVALTPSGGSTAYLGWLLAETAARPAAAARRARRTR